MQSADVGFNESHQLEPIAQQLKAAKNNTELYQSIVNAPFSNKLLTTSLDLGIIVFLIVNEEDKTVDRVALSDTELAQNVMKISAKPFHDIRIPYGNTENAIVEVIKDKSYKVVDDWYYLFTPELTAEEARRNQRGASIECSMVWSLRSYDAALIFSFYQPSESLTDDHINFIQAYSQIVDASLKEHFAVGL